ncbi:MAG: hypothetical protein GXO39_04715 [Thermotogae bacterium]|nr:hypothetical protein [Thermotogota bacterium]
MLVFLGYLSEVWLQEGTCEAVRLRNENEYVVPASTLKSMWAVVLLNRLSANYRIPTYVITGRNSLILRFEGDPFLRLRALDSLLREKFSQMRGKSVHVLISFPRWGERYGYGWAWDDIKLRRVSPITPLSINGGRLREDTSLGIKVVDTLPLDSCVWTGIHLLIPKDNFRYSDPLKVIKFIVTRAARRAGKRVRIEVLESDRFSFGGLKVDTLWSPPLNRMLRPILKYSLNFHMDMLVAHYSGGITRAGRIFKRFMGELGMDTVAYVFDGSGLSRYNLIRALDGVYMVCAGSRTIKPYLDSILPAPGSGTLKRRLVEFKDMLRAKTGTLFGVSALLGFYEGCNDRYVFGVYLQNSPLLRSSRDFIDSLVIWSSGGRRCLFSEKEER